MKKFLLLAVVTFCSLFLSVNAKMVQAADDPTTDPTGRNITITPPTMELFANPGDTITDKIRVINNANTTSTFGITIEDFKAVGEDGSVGFDDQKSTTFSLASWVTPEIKSFTLAPNEEKTINFSIQVPKDAEPGGHYASVLAKIGGDAKVQSGASVVSRVGSLILLRVSGNVKEAANIESFTSSKFFYNSLPVDFELRVKNSGNNHIRPRGTILITNTFGQKVTEISLEGSNVLPDAIRKMESSWKQDNKMAVGFYTATLVSTYGQQNLPLSATVRFLVCPTWLIYTLSGLLLLIIVLVLSKKKIKKMVHNMTK